MVHAQDPLGSDAEPVKFVSREQFVGRLVVVYGEAVGVAHDLRLQVHPDRLCIDVGLEAQLAEAERQRQVGFLVAVRLGLLAVAVTDHHMVSGVMVAIDKPLELNP